MRSRLVLAATLATALAAPTAASAAGTISGGPAKVAGGYQLSVHATDARPDTFMIALSKTARGRSEQQMLSFAKGVKVSVKGASASIKGSLKQWGSVNLTLRDARTAKRVKTPKGCVGRSATTRTGTLRGKLRFRLPNGSFATVTSLPAQTYVGGTLDCSRRDTTGKGDGSGGDGGAGGEPTLMLTKQAGGTTTSFIATKRSLVATRIEDPKKTQPATVIRTISASGSNLLTVAGGGASAHVRSAGAFTGDGAFTATLNSGSFATGPLAGSLRVRLPGAGTLALTGEDAVLLNGDKQ